MVLADSHRISLSPWYLGYFQEPIVFAYEAITLYGCIFQNDSANESVYSLIYSKLIWKSHNTCDATIRVFNTPQGLDCFHFARRYSGNHYCFIFHQVLRCFSSLSLLFSTYVFLALGCPIRKSPGLRLLPSIRGLSQVTTSFFAY